LLGWRATKKSDGPSDDIDVDDARRQPCICLCLLRSSLGKSRRSSMWSKRASALSAPSSFLEYARKLRIIVLRQKSFTTALSIAHAKRHHPGMKERKLLKSLKTNPLSYYSCLKQPNRAAPASIQSLISSLILSCSSCTVQLLPSNRRLFHSFQIAQMMHMMSVEPSPTLPHLQVSKMLPPSVQLQWSLKGARTIHPGE